MRKPEGEDFAIKRSDKPRVTRTEEESKPGGFARGPPRQEPADTGFARSNFKAKKEGEEAKAEENPKRPERQSKPSEAPKEQSDASGFGFRSTNPGAAKGARGRGRGKK